MALAAKLCLDQVGMMFRTPAGDFEALAPVTLSIAKGRFVSLIGPSGCGKSTIFNIVAGLLQPTGGRVFIDGIDATGVQKDLLLPWRKVLDNVILGMEIQGLPLAQARERALPQFGLCCPGATRRRFLSIFTLTSELIFHPRMYCWDWSLRLKKPTLRFCLLSFRTRYAKCSGGLDYWIASERIDFSRPLTTACKIISGDTRRVVAVALR
jgi:ABC-type sugar transport system ATPase subunit